MRDITEILAIITLATVGVIAPNTASAEEKSLKDACKTECPKAKSDHEAHACMKNVVKKKKNDKTFLATDCYAALKEHEEHEKKEGHHDDDHKHE